MALGNQQLKEADYMADNTTQSSTRNNTALTTQSPISFSLFQSSTGPLTKKIGIDFIEGGLAIDGSSCALSTGNVSKIQIESLAELPDALKQIGMDQAIGLGINRSEYSQIASECRLADTPGAISRSKQNFHWGESGLGLIDYDPAPKGFPIDSPEKLIAILATVDPQWEKVDYVRTYSTSSGIYETGGKCLKPASGMHIYFRMVGKPHSVNRYWDVLFKRLWLAGYGHLFLTKDGKMLPRTVFDRAVMSPERLVFESGASLVPGLEQRRPEPEYYNAGAGGAIDTSKPTRFLPADEVAYRGLVEIEKAKMQKQADRVREKYITARCDDLVKAHAGSVTRDQARRIIESRINMVLTPNDLIHIDDDKWVFAGVLLANPNAYQDKTCADPLEPFYGSREGIPARNKAVIKVDDHDAVTVVSLAHGGRVFVVKHDAGSLCKLLDEKDDLELANSWARAVIDADLDRTGQRIIFNLIKTRLGMNQRDFNADLKAVIDDQMPVEDNHQSLAQSVIDKHLTGQYPDGVISVDGELFVCTGQIWERIPDDGMVQLIGQSFDNMQTCKRRGDYKGILAQIHDTLDNPGFFNLDKLPSGVAAAGRFYRLADDGSINAEDLDPRVHRCRFMLPVAPQNAGNTGGTPKWSAFLQSTKIGADQEKLLQEVMGSTLFGTMPKYQKLVGLYGVTDSGKSLITRLLEMFFPEHMRTTVRPSQWGEPYWRARLVNALLNVAGDLPHEGVIQSAIVKQISGGDGFDTREVHGKVQVNHRNTAAHFFTFNAFPNTRADDAFFGRWLLLRFNVTIPESKQVTDLEVQIFREELPGLLAWMFTGAQRVIQNNGFTTTTAGLDMVNKWRVEADSVRAFLHDVDTVVLTGDPANTIERSRIYQTYRYWCRDNGRRAQAKGHALISFDTMLGTATKIDGVFRYSGIAVAAINTGFNV